MASSKTNEHRKYIDKVLSMFGVVATLVLLAAGGLAWWAYSFTTSTVHDQLSAQKIYFPPKGSAALDPQEFPGLQHYAGQQVLTGPQAKAFADEFIAVHLTKAANGQTYSQVSAAALQDPTNVKLQNQANTLFKGETLRGLLLGDAYAFWTIGQIAKIAAILCFAAAGVMTILTVFGFRHLSTL
jgi:hypothetical protein